MKRKNHAARNVLLIGASVITLGLVALYSCNKKDVADVHHAPSKTVGSQARTTSCTNPFDWVGIFHNQALAAALAVSPKPTTADEVLSLAKSTVSAMTQDPATLALINSYPMSSLTASDKLATAFLAADDATIAKYCSGDEAILAKQLFDIINKDQEISDAMDQVSDWACGVQGNVAIAGGLRDQMLATSAVAVKSMEYWHQVLGGKTPESRHWFSRDIAGAIVGGVAGGPFGVLIGGAAGSLFAGIFG